MNNDTFSIAERALRTISARDELLSYVAGFECDYDLSPALVEWERVWNQSRTYHDQVMDELDYVTDEAALWERHRPPVEVLDAILDRHAL